MNEVAIAVIGLGDDAKQIAAGLQAAGAKVIGFDTAKIKHPPVPLAESLDSAVAEADVVISLNSSAVASRTATSALPSLKPGAIFADLNAGTPSLKKRLAEILPADAFVDVAVTQPLDGLAHRVPCDASGAAAKRFQSLMAPLGMQIEVVSNRPGDAAARQLIRSLFAKGMSAVVADTLWAAKALAIDAWAYQSIKEQFDDNNSATVQGYLDDAGKHPKRRSVEMTDITETLADAGYESTLVNGIGLTYSHIMHGRKIPFADLSDD